MLLGIPVYLALTRFAPTGRAVAAAAWSRASCSLAIWAVNFYAHPVVASAAAVRRPLDLDQRSYLPWWVAAATHLVFGWTIACSTR